MIYSIKRNEKGFEIIDQTLLPSEEKLIMIDDYRQMIDAVKRLAIRGAPAIGIAAAVAVYLASVETFDNANYHQELALKIIEIENSRPTAVNLFNATNKIKGLIKHNPIKEDCVEIISDFVEELMQYEERASNQMAENGFGIIPKHFTTFLTHCNTGSLATFGSGTALSVIKRIAKDRKIKVFVDETRPLLQGARLTMWELMKDDIDCTLICDNMASSTIREHKIDAILTGADRIAKNYDTANKIGTFNLAILAKHFNIPFYIVAPETTIDESIKTGKEILIEERDKSEVCGISAPENANALNPAFDVTPFNLISAVITDKRIIKISNNNE
jgi:methylthioribose-1-phosphate isomerase